MQRVTISIEEELLAALDGMVQQHGYQNRSEAVRDLVRAGLSRPADGPPAQQPSVGVLVYAYDHDTRDLPKRLAHAFHDHPAVAISTLHVHVSHETCVEATVLRGKAGAVRHLAEHVIAERGVRHGQLVLLPDPAVPDRSARPPASARHRH